jgi:hypothetical protein
VKPVRLPPEAKRQVESFEGLKVEVAVEVEKLRAELESIRAEAVAARQSQEPIINAMIADRTVAADLVAGAWGDYENAVAEARADVLSAKSRPALAAAEEVREKGRRLAALRSESKYARWLLELYEWHFPWLADLREEGTLGELLDGGHDEEGTSGDEVDPVNRWVTKAEFTGLTPAERNQIALDRFLRGRQSPWQIGRDYELYIGYLREQAGFRVTYHGILEGLDDLGRDLLASRDHRIEVIQCKRWAQHKTIHEKHVFQLFGTVVAARLENPGSEVIGTFVTTTSLSERARRFADHLEMQVEERVPMGDYPRIKCNISRRSGERIYHLPFDQQYDTTVIEADRAEFFAHTVAEAEERGFRRAWRWRGES